MILVAGGSGTLGTRLIPLLTRRGTAVRILTRNPDGAPHPAGSQVEVVGGDVRDARAVERALTGARTVISAITGFGMARDVSARSVDWEGNANLIRAAKAAGVEHYILLSVCQAAPAHPIELFRMKHRAEEELRASGLAWTIIRPTAYMETWLAILGDPLLRTGTTRIFGAGRNPINFVSADDVAGLVDSAVADEAMRGVAIDVGGPDNLSMAEVVETFRTLTGARGTVRHVPRPVMRVMSAVMKPFNPAMAAVIEAAVVMDTRDMTFDPTEMRRRHPSIPMTPLADVIRHGYLDRASAGVGETRNHAVT
ncbi:MAG TPA: SDR family oxidoreductase [Candidatus Bathyarchaeia archaeon]|nr:SDR family oxidoreductase [Candidatus Bathyarchaeia archaeon]